MQVRNNTWRFINRLMSNEIWQRLLEIKTDFQTAFDAAYLLDVAQQSSNVYSQSITHAINAAVSLRYQQPEYSGEPSMVAALNQTSKTKTQSCCFCGSNRRPWSKCLAWEAICHRCKNVGYFVKLCRLTSVSAAVPKPDTDDDYLCSAVASANSPFCLTSTISLNDTYKAEALIDSWCTDESFISEKLCKILILKIILLWSTNGVASASQSKGYCTVALKLGDETYKKVRLHVLDWLCIDINLGTDFLEQNESLTITYGGSKHLISFAVFNNMNTDPPPLFADLTADCKPMATKSRKHSKADQDFICNEVKCVVEAGIIEASNSPWRAQELVVSEKSKPRMVVDYSETMNKYTQLDVHPLTKINEVVDSIAKY